MSSGHRVVRHDGAAAFLAAAQAWLERDEVENNVILAIALGLAASPAPPVPPPYLATLLDGDAIVGCALRTPPHKLALTRFEPRAATVLVDAIHAAYPTLDAVVGPEPSVDAFAAAWAERTGASVRRGVRQQIYVLTAVEPPARLVPGSYRAVTDDDLATLTPWIADFFHQVGDQHSDPAEYLGQRRAGIRLWDDDGPVSMAASFGQTVHGARVSLVYTPPELRGRGYAGACVTALSRELLAGGNRHCCLYTDLSNPVSNRIYQRIGYRPVCPVSDWLLGA
jgi:GNAT superfamily N-acetyltransferase